MSRAAADNAWTQDPPMRLIPSRVQILFIALLGHAFGILTLLPRFGPPSFRYTGSDPSHHVWNFGWPLATCIYDSAHSPHLFVGPFAYAYILLAFVGFTFLYIALVVWNHRKAVHRSTAKEPAH